MGRRVSDGFRNCNRYFSDVWKWDRTTNLFGTTFQPGEFAPVNGMRGQRKKPTVREAIPVAFEFLKSDGLGHESRTIFDHVTMSLAQRGFEEKRIAINFALTWMCREGLIRKLRHGYWQITGIGMFTEMTLELADNIEQRHGSALDNVPVLQKRLKFSMGKLPTDEELKARWQQEKIVRKHQDASKVMYEALKNNSSMARRSYDCD